MVVVLSFEWALNNGLYAEAVRSVFYYELELDGTLWERDEQTPAPSASWRISPPPPQRPTIPWHENTQLRVAYSCVTHTFGGSS